MGKQIIKDKFRCDFCGRFISLKDLVSGIARRILITPDSHSSREEFETVCKKCK